ncbi:hypothetical protein NKG99_14350 [Mesorhizobium sp. M1409]|uniref:hypothetical protein n=1 Tax=unclassified Mesorhizobium TaxID=325217 RepID=UPI00333AC25A
MAGRLDLSKLRDTGTLEWDPTIEWDYRKEELLLAEAMGGPLQIAVDNWNRRFGECIPPTGAEECDLDKRIEDEVWLLHHHGYGAMQSLGPGRHRSASVYWHGEPLPAEFCYEVYSLDDLCHAARPAAQYHATGGREPGEYERARDHAESIGGVVLQRCFVWVEDGEPVHCMYFSENITPKRAYDAFMQMYDDGTVIARFIPLFKRMMRREHRNVEATADRTLEHYQRLGEISFYLTEVREWKAARDSRVALGKGW